MRLLQHLSLGAAAWILGAGPASATLLDFTTDDGGTSLEHGQIVDAAFDPIQEFGNLVNVSSTQIGGGSGHLGVTVFDTNFGGATPDPDLLVGLGNALILQNDANPATSAAASGGLKYDTPNDEKDSADAGSIVFDFLISNVTVLSIDLIDLNGGNSTIVSLTDSSGDQRIWTLAADFTGNAMYDTLDLTNLAVQVGNGGGTATVTTNDAGFDASDVVTLEVAFLGNPVSGALDNVLFVPEPAAIALLAGLAGLAGLARRRS